MPTVCWVKSSTSGSSRGCYTRYRVNNCYLVRPTAKRTVVFLQFYGYSVCGNRLPVCDSHKAPSTCQTCILPCARTAAASVVFTYEPDPIVYCNTTSPGTSVFCLTKPRRNPRGIVSESGGPGASATTSCGSTGTCATATSSVQGSSHAVCC